MISVLIRNIIKSSREFQLFLKNPVIRKEKKQQVLEVVFGKSIQPLTREFLQLLTEKGREEILPQIIDKFLQLRDIRLGTVGVDVKTAIELSKEQISQLEKWFEVYTKKKIQFNFNLDKQLIGGIVARVDDTMFDGSVKRQLELIRQRLIEEVNL